MPEKNQEPGLRSPEQLLAAQNLVLEMIALGSPLGDILRAITSFIDQQEPSGRCCIFLMEPDGRTLRLAVALNLPESFTGEAQEQLIVGACGAATSRLARVMVPEIADGLCSCWAMPIVASEGAALGAVGIYHDRPHVPEATEIGIVERAAYLARIAIERRRFEERLEAGKEHFRAL